MRNTHGAGKAAMGFQMQGLAMGGNRNLRFDPLIKLFHFPPTRMPRHMHQGIAIGDHIDPLQDQLVDLMADAFFVAGNSARGENHLITRRQRDVGMVTIGNTGQRGPWLALRTRDQGHDFVARQIAIDIDRTKIRQAFQQTAFTRHFDDAIHGTPHSDHLTPTGRRRFRHSADPRHIGGKGCDTDTPFGFGDNLFERARHFRFAGADAIPRDIGGVANQRQNTLIAQTAQALFIGCPTDIRRDVNFPVAAMEQRAQCGLDNQPHGFRNGMGHLHGFDGERAKHIVLAGLDDMQRQMLGTGLAKTPDLQKACSKARGIDRRFQ